MGLSGRNTSSSTEFHIQIMQQATNRVCRQHRFRLFQQIFVGVGHTAVVTNRDSSYR
jgi:hypothetical protein